MNITTKLSVEDIGTDYKNQERARLRVKCFVNNESIGDKDGLIYATGIKKHIQALCDGLISLEDFKKLNQ